VLDQNEGEVVQSTKMESETSQQSALDPELSAPADSPVHSLDLLLIFVKRRRFILRFVVVATLLTTLLVFVLPSRYTAVTVIMPPNQNSPSTAILSQLGAASGLAASAGAGLGIKNPEDMYVDMLRSRTVEEAVIHRFNMQQKYHAATLSKARRALERHTSVASNVKNGFISVSATDADPRVAADIANGYLDAFRSKTAQLALTEAGQRRKSFEEQLRDESDKLTDAENALKSTEQSTGVLDVGSQTRALVVSASTIRAQLDAREVLLQTMHAYATDENPEVARLQEQITALKEQLAHLTGSDQDQGLILPKGKVPEAGLEYMRRLRDVKYHETVFEMLARQYEIAKVDEARQGAIIQVIDPAAPPDERSFPKRTLTICVVFVLSLILAFLYCVGADGWRRWKRKPEVRSRLDQLHTS